MSAGVWASYRSEGEDDGHLLAVGLHDLGVDRGNIGDELELTGLEQLGDWRREAPAAGQHTGRVVGRQVKSSSTQELLGEAVEVGALEDTLEELAHDLLVGQAGRQELARERWKKSTGD